MPLFNFGGTRSDSNSESTSSSFDNLDAFNFDFGFNTSSNRSESGGRSRSGGRSGSDQRIAFDSFFRDLFADASGAADSIDTSGVTNAASLLFNSGRDIIGQLQDGGAGRQALEDRLTARDGLADEQIEQLGADLSRFLAEDASTAITASGVSANALGGSRGEVQRGIATRGASEAFVRGSTDIRLRDQSARDSIAAQLMQGDADRAGAAGNLLPQLFGLAEGGANASLAPFLALSQIFGQQTALTSSDSENFSESDQFSRALAEALGINFGGGRTTGRAGSQSRSTSSSSSRGFNLGFE